MQSTMQWHRAAELGSAQGVYHNGGFYAVCFMQLKAARRNKLVGHLHLFWFTFLDQCLWIIPPFKPILGWAGNLPCKQAGSVLGTLFELRERCGEAGRGHKWLWGEGSPLGAQGPACVGRT